MSPISLLFGTYNQQPDGTTAEAFEESYQRSYKPFLSLLYKHPRLHTVLHYSGSLFEWLEDQHPEFIMLLKEMVRRKQVELLGGGHHAPILPLIPDGDKLGQIEKMSTFIRTTFGTRPWGSWLAERVWEPTLARILSNSGIEYTFLDDEFNRQYGNDHRRGEIYKYFTALAIFISCLGLFGMASFTAEQRTKEIGIRKVMGATAVDIFRLLSRENLVFIAISNLIAWPLGYAAMKAFLQNYPLRILLGIEIFLMAALAAFVIAFMTIFYQTFRAAQANPSETLKYE